MCYKHTRNCFFPVIQYFIDVFRKTTGNSKTWFVYNFQSVNELHNVFKKRMISLAKNVFVKNTNTHRYKNALLLVHSSFSLEFKNTIYVIILYSNIYRYIQMYWNQYKPSRPFFPGTPSKPGSPGMPSRPSKPKYLNKSREYTWYWFYKMKLNV